MFLVHGKNGLGAPCKTMLQFIGGDWGCVDEIPKTVFCWKKAQIDKILWREDQQASNFVHKTIS